MADPITGVQELSNWIAHIRYADGAERDFHVLAEDKDAAEQVARFTVAEAGYHGFLEVVVSPAPVVLRPDPVDVHGMSQGAGLCVSEGGSGVSYPLPGEQVRVIAGPYIERFAEVPGTVIDRRIVDGRVFLSVLRPGFAFVTCLAHEVELVKENA